MTNSTLKLNFHHDMRTRRPGGTYDSCAGSGRVLEGVPGSNGVASECPVCRRVVLGKVVR
jgi:hypothetical protein